MSDVEETASVTPSHKSGSKSDLNSYRPISVTPVFVRMLERLAQDKLSEFLKVNNILTSSQVAFRKLNSITAYILSSTDQCLANMDNNKLKLTIFLNFGKAVNTVDHDIIIKKLSSNGIANRAGDWFESYP